MQRTPIVEEDIQVILATCHEELQSLSGKTLLLTGGSGFIGSYLVESIIAFNHSYSGEPCRLLLPTRSLATTHKKWPHFFNVPNVEWFEWDGAVLEPPSEVCDYLIHAASPADPAAYLHAPKQTMEDIANGTLAVLRYAQQAQVNTLLYLSSGAAYGQQPTGVDALSEDSLSAPDIADTSACYGEAKRFSELLCRTANVNTIIARLFAFIGPYQDMSGSFAAPNFIRQALHNNTIRINSDGSALRTYCYASDLSISLWKLLLNGKSNELYNVGSGTPSVSIRKLADLIASEIGNTEVIIESKIATSVRSRYIPNVSKLNSIYTAQIGLAEGLSRTLSSYQHAQNN